MRTSKIHLLAIALLIGLSFTACKKSDNTNNSLAGTDVTATQDAESQDAQAENVDQSVDNITDALEANNFSATKSTEGGSPTITLTFNGSKQDTTAFPITIKIDYGSASDSSINGETFKQSGYITITAARTKQTGSWKNCIKKTIDFRNYTCGNDSASFSISGTRVVSRISTTMTPLITTLDQYLAATALRYAITDSINSNLTFTVTCSSFPNGISYTRIVKRERIADAHFAKAVNGLIWYHKYLNDSLSYTGTVNGVNFMGFDYSRVITSPIVFTRCIDLIPVISSGMLTVSRDTATNSEPVVTTISYSKNACKTTVTVTKNGKTKVFDRRLNRLYKKWW